LHFNNFLYLLGEEEEVIQPPVLRIFYDCQTKQGHFAIHWKLDLGELDLAYMQFHMLSTTEDQYQWKLEQP
jgi:hypothetical protein